MCLLSKSKNPLVADEDFDVWKVVRFSKQAPATWKGAYNFSSMHFPFDEELQEGPFEINESNGAEGMYEIHGGCFHSVMLDCIAVATGILRVFNEHSSGNYIMCKCTIPKGTEYYAGGGMIASKSIIVHKPESLRMRDMV